MAPRTFVFRASNLPLFLETWNVGVLEGVLLHAGAGGAVRVAAQGIATAAYEVTLR